MGRKEKETRGDRGRGNFWASDATSTLPHLFYPRLLSLPHLVYPRLLVLSQSVLPSTAAASLVLRHGTDGGMPLKTAVRDTEGSTSTVFVLPPGEEPRSQVFIS